MSGRPRAGHKAERKERATPATPTAPEQNPLDFALAFMRDDSKPDTLRVSVAKAAMPYLHKRGEENDEPEPEPTPAPMSDLELARRIAHILARGNEQVERERALVPGAVQHERSEVMRRRTGTHAPIVDRWVPDQQCTAKARCTASGTREDDERAQRDDPFDPHPGYRWIP